MPNPIAHFEIPANDPEKLSEFYSGVFGWNVDKQNVGMDYWMLMTKDGEVGIDGGMYKKTEESQAPINYVMVNSADDAAEKVKGAGGQIIMGKNEIESVGSFYICLDPEGNPFGIWEDANKEA